MDELEPDNIKLTDKDVRKYHELCVKNFDQKLSDKEAGVKLNALFTQLEIAYQPITREQLQRLLDERGGVQCS